MLHAFQNLFALAFMQCFPGPRRYDLCALSIALVVYSITAFRAAISHRGSTFKLFLGKLVRVHKAHLDDSPLTLRM